MKNNFNAKTLNFNARVYAKKLIFFFDMEPGLKATRTSFSTRKLARVYVQQGTLDKGTVFLRTYFMRPRKSCEEKNIVKFRVHWSKLSLSRKTCSSVRGFTVEHV